VLTKLAAEQAAGQRTPKEGPAFRLTNFYANFDVRLTEALFVEGARFTAADITAVVTVDFARKAMDFPLPEEHPSWTRRYDARCPPTVSRSDPTAIYPCLRAENSTIRTALDVSLRHVQDLTLP
jgi:glutathione S-transferase